MTSLSNVAEANITPLWEPFGNEQSLTAQQVEGLHTFNVLIATPIATSDAVSKS